MFIIPTRSWWINMKLILILDLLGSDPYAYNFRQTHICLTRRTGLASVTWIRDNDVSKPACCVTPVIKAHDDSTCEFSSNSASRIYTLELDLNQLKFWIHDTRFCEYHQKQSYLILFNFQGIFLTGEVAVWIEGTHLSYSFVLVVTRETSIQFDGVVQWQCKKDVFPSLTHWSYVFLALQNPLKCHGVCVRPAMCQIGLCCDVADDAIPTTRPSRQK